MDRRAPSLRVRTAKGMFRLVRKQANRVERRLEAYYQDVYLLGVSIWVGGHCWSTARWIFPDRTIIEACRQAFEYLLGCVE